MEENVLPLKPKSAKEIMDANDVVKTYTWLDAGNDDERIDTISYSSALLGRTVLRSFTYSGGPGTYLVATETYTNV